jgi:C-terminal region of aryl-sulfatase
MGRRIERCGVEMNTAMNRRRAWMYTMRTLGFLAACLLWAHASIAHPLPSWNDGPARQSIVKFVSDVTKQGARILVNLLPFLTEKGVKSPRKGLIYFDDDGDLVAVRFDNWKIVFMEQRRAGTLGVWAEPFVPLRSPKLYNLRTDPFERADITSNTYYDWFLSKLYMIGAAGAIVEEFLATFKQYPPSQRAATFTIDQALEKMKEALSGAHH